MVIIQTGQRTRTCSKCTEPIRIGKPHAVIASTRIGGHDKRFLCADCLRGLCKQLEEAEREG